MTERHGSDPADPGRQRPSGRGSVTERLARPGGGAHAIDLTDERDERDTRETSGSFEPAPPADPAVRPADPGAATADAGARSTSIFDTGERARQDDPEPAGEERVAPEVPGREVPAAEGAVPAPAAGPPASLLGSLDADDIRNRFLDIQAGFVDEPRQAVEEAGRFVDDLIRQVVEALQGQRGQLTATPAEGSTEDLRLALRDYRQFVDRLLGLAR